MPSADYGFDAKTSERNRLLYQIILNVETERYVVSHFEYRANPVIGKLASGISIVRFVEKNVKVYFSYMYKLIEYINKIYKNQ